MLLDCTFYVATHVGDSIFVNQVYKACFISLNGDETLVDLNVLDMVVFHVILGIDWLASCHVTIDCHSKTIKFGFFEKPIFQLQGDHSIAPYNWISSLGARHLLRKGCMGYLAMVRDMSMPARDINNILIVNEFPSVFLDEFPSLPPNREIEFCIVVVLDTQPISMSPYHMAPTELKELKD